MKSRQGKKRIAILGAGPVGIEAALYAAGLGHSITVYERGRVGDHIRRWQHLRLFSPWSMNVSPLGLETLREAKRPLPDLSAFPTGRELVTGYLEPLAERLGGHLRVWTDVLGVYRSRKLKGDDVGSPDRAASPFEAHLRADGHERLEEADVVIDATGVYGRPCGLGSGGGPALGESACGDRIDHHLVDLNGPRRRDFAGATTLLVGSGFSAATLLEAFAALQEEEPSTRLIWAWRKGARDAIPEVPDDPLAERARLSRLARAWSSQPPHWLSLRPQSLVRSIERRSGHVVVSFVSTQDSAAPAPVEVERILSLVGYRPETSIYEELQVHQCYASEGPMALAAALQGQAAGGDCLTQRSPGPAALKTSEPGFFILGHKSYGRRNDFLLRVGIEQVRDAFRLIEGDPGLDLYRDAAERAP